MTTWSTIEPLTAEHVAYLAETGVRLPVLAATNRAPTRADVVAAYEAIDRPADLELDLYNPVGAFVVSLRGHPDRMLRFLVALAARCGQLYMFGSPLDRMPGAVADRGDDLEAVVARLDADTRAALTYE